VTHCQRDTDDNAPSSIDGTRGDMRMALFGQPQTSGCVSEMEMWQGWTRRRPAKALGMTSTPETRAPLADPAADPPQSFTTKKSTGRGDSTAGALAMARSPALP